MAQPASQVDPHTRAQLNSLRIASRSRLEPTISPVRSSRASCDRRQVLRVARLIAASAPDLSVEQVIQESDPIEQARIGAHIIRTLNERSWPVADILRSAHGRDESLTELWYRWQERHLYAVRRAVENLADHHALRAGVDADEAVDVLYAVAGTEVYRALVRERGWSPQRYEDWLFRTMCRELLP